ncbi:hypothetical protein OOT46_03775 [Aquabacterium sp. A7-Y]|uniref:hypothetical protein n=1 Tax=Aquabacterium sp. A7-Y TaxID=1349605 RepID=UPI00223E348A|nr:hypothetical protein [Aquabacterium sp. A7-Y]MCW7536972.1 hypothetical protein [Aquabacterium sp. A7-Y]
MNPLQKGGQAMDSFGNNALTSFGHGQVADSGGDIMKSHNKNDAQLDDIQSQMKSVMAQSMQQQVLQMKENIKMDSIGHDAKMAQKALDWVE